MPRTKSKSSGNKPLPANQQKGKKVCTFYVAQNEDNRLYYSNALKYKMY